MRVVDSADRRPRRSARSQAVRAFAEVRELLLSGEFAPGEHVAELPLASRLGISRTPIRLALERLAHAGLLRISTGGRFRLRGFSPDEALDILEIRGVLEGTAARLAAERLNDSRALKPLDWLCEQIEEVGRLSPLSAPSYAELDETFHATLVAAGRCSIVRSMLSRIAALPFASPSAMARSTNYRDEVERQRPIALEHHRAIVSAISRREGTRAEQLAREHAALDRRVLQRVLTDRACHDVPGAALFGVGCSERPPGNRGEA